MIRAFAISFGFLALALICAAMVSCSFTSTTTIVRDGLRGRLEVQS